MRALALVVGGTLEKVGLSLPVSCTFQVRKAPEDSTPRRRGGFEFTAEASAAQLCHAVVVASPRVLHARPRAQFEAGTASSQ